MPTKVEPNGVPLAGTSAGASHDRAELTVGQQTWRAWATGGASEPGGSQSAHVSRFGLVPFDSVFSGMAHLRDTISASSPCSHQGWGLRAAAWLHHAAAFPIGLNLSAMNRSRSPRRTR